MSAVIVKYKKLSEEAETPFRKHSEDAGFDLVATSMKYHETDGKYEYGLGLAFDIPKGHWGDLRPRSSVHKTGMVLSNSCGVLDRNYRGEVKAFFYKVGKHAKPYEVGDRILQLIITNADPEEVEFVEVGDLEETNRGIGGFGSTGK